MASRNKDRMISYNFLSIKPGETRKELLSRDGAEVTLIHCPERQTLKNREFEFEHIYGSNGNYYELFVRDIADMEVLRRALAHINHTKSKNIILVAR